MVEVVEDTPREVTTAGVLTNAAKLIGEVALVPGVSLAVDGNVKSGVAHAAAALAAGVVLGPVLGPIAWFAAALDSYSSSVSGLHIHQHFYKKKDVVVD